LLATRLFSLEISSRTPLHEEAVQRDGQDKLEKLVWIRLVSHGTYFSQDGVYHLQERF